MGSYDPHRTYQISCVRTRCNSFVTWVPTRDETVFDLTRRQRLKELRLRPWQLGDVGLPFGLVVDDAAPPSSAEPAGVGAPRRKLVFESSGAAVGVRRNAAAGGGRHAVPVSGGRIRCGGRSWPGGTRQLAEDDASQVQLVGERTADTADGQLAATAGDRRSAMAIDGVWVGCGCGEAHSFNVHPSWGDERESPPVSE